jgi:hypothetical protein
VSGRKIQGKSREKVLRPKSKVSEYVLITLYERGGDGATYKEIEAWVHPSMRRNLRRSLGQLEHNSAFVHLSGDRYVITKHINAKF